MKADYSKLECCHPGCIKTRPKAGGRLCAMHRSRKRKGQDMDAPSRVGKKGGGTVNGNGYKIFYLPNHPNSSKHGYVSEHVKVMAESLGRPLQSHENVHHKNGVRTDNRLDNLELWTTHQPKGKKVKDLVEWAKWILKEYNE